MATRVGIELAPDACRIVEIDAAPPWARRQRATRVRSFAVLPPSGPETEASLRPFRNRRASVVVWSTCEHRQVVVSAGSYESMRADAINSLAAAGLEMQGAWVDIAPVRTEGPREARRPVVVALASGSEQTMALRPLQAAGIRLRSVTTSAAALWSLARMRRSTATGALELLIAFEERVTCIAVIRAGVLVAVRNLDWGFIDARRSGGQLRQQDDITTRLADAITEFVAAMGGSAAEIGQVSVCGGLPELRSTTVPLMERLDVEVEPLDSLFGIDAANLPAPVDEFCERAAELRLAWAAAADWPPPINLLRARHRQASKTAIARAAVVAGVAAGTVAAWRVQQRPWWRSATPPPSQAPANAGAAARVPPAVAASTPIVVSRPAAATAPPVTPPSTVASQPPVAATAVVVPPKAPITAGAVVPPQAPVAAGAAVVPPKAPVAASATAAAPVIPAATAPRAESPRARANSAPPNAPLPFDAALGSILYSAERQLAIVDGRIVGVGDEVRGARIVDITPTTVVLRDAAGRLWRLALGAGGR